MIELTMEYVSIILSAILLVLLSRFLLTKHHRYFYTIYSLPTLIRSFYLMERRHWLVFSLLFFAPFFDALWIVIIYSVVTTILIYLLFQKYKKDTIIWNTKTLRTSFVLLVIATVFGSAIFYLLNPKELVPVLILIMVTLVLLFSLSTLILWPFEWIVQVVRLLFIKRKNHKQGVVSVLIFRSREELSLQNSINTETTKIIKQPGVFIINNLIQSMEEFLVEYDETFGKDNRVLIVEMDVERWKYAQLFRFILQTEFVILSEDSSKELNPETIEDMFKNEKTVYFKNILNNREEDKRFIAGKQGCVFIPKKKEIENSYQPIRLEIEGSFFDWVIQDIFVQIGK